MSCSTLPLTLGILSSLLFGDVGASRLPFVGDDDPNRITSRTYSESNPDVPRSLDMEDFDFSAMPTSGRVSSPTIMRLHPVSVKPSHLHANLPLRFGRQALTERMPKSSINLPQRFGRDSGLLCTECRRAEAPSATLPQRFGRRNIFVGDPFRALAVLTRSLELPFPKDRTQDYDYMLEPVQEEDKDLKSQKYFDLEEGNL